ncbi:MAG TPA: MFS transporter [Acidimicrobiales bacterium]|nr:MFS transporter [Acidimicrobiales bacterium]
MGDQGTSPSTWDRSPSTSERAGRARGPSHPGMVLALVCIGQFMVVLDLSIVNVALPSMQRDLGFSTPGLQWVVNAYALAFGGFLLLGGRAADLFGRRRIFMSGLVLFAGASLVCGIAPDQAMLVGARALQGLGAAVLSPATLTILTVTFQKPAERARALGIWSAMAAVGGASGALLGGILTDLLSWRWVFYINIPVAVAALVAARVVLAESRADSARRALDVPGAVVVTAALVSLVYAVAGTDTHAWGAPATVIPLALAGALSLVFVAVEAKARAPLMPFRLFRSRALSASNVAMLLVGGAMFSMWFFVSLYMQDVLRFSPLTTGLGFLPQTVAIAVGAQISSRLITRLGPRLPLVAGIVCSAVGLWWLSRLSPGGGYWTSVFGGADVATFGMGLALTPLAFAATAGVAPAEAGLASGVLNTSRQVGASCGLAALATIAANRTHALLTQGAGAASARAHDAAALSSGFSRGLALSAVIAAVGLLPALCIPRQPRREPAPGAEQGGGAEPAPASERVPDAVALAAEPEG